MKLNEHSSTKTSPLRQRRYRSAISAPLGCIGLVLLSTRVFAQDDVDAELEAAEQAAAEKASEESPEAAPAPTAEETPESSATSEASPASEPAPTAPSAPVEEAPQPAPQASPPSGGDRELDEVVVTADRRSKSLQDYAGVAQAFSQETLQKVGVTGVTGLAALVPGLQIGQQEGNTEVYIRGVGVGAHSPS